MSDSIISTHNNKLIDLSLLAYNLAADAVKGSDEAKRELLKKLIGGNACVEFLFSSEADSRLGINVEFMKGVWSESVIGVESAENSLIIAFLQSAAFLSSLTEEEIVDAIVKLGGQLSDHAFQALSAFLSFVRDKITANLIFRILEKNGASLTSPVTKVLMNSPQFIQASAEHSVRASHLLGSGGLGVSNYLEIPSPEVRGKLELDVLRLFSVNTLRDLHTKMSGFEAEKILVHISTMPHVVLKDILDLDAGRAIYRKLERYLSQLSGRDFYNAIKNIRGFKLLSLFSFGSEVLLALNERLSRCFTSVSSALQVDKTKLAQEIAALSFVIRELVSIHNVEATAILNGLFTKLGERVNSWGSFRHEIGEFFADSVSTGRLEEAKLLFQLMPVGFFPKDSIERFVIAVGDDCAFKSDDDAGKKYNKYMILYGSNTQVSLHAVYESCAMKPKFYWWSAVIDHVKCHNGTSMVTVNQSGYNVSLPLNSDKLSQSSESVALGCAQNNAMSSNRQDQPIVAPSASEVPLQPTVQQASTSTDSGTVLKVVGVMIKLAYLVTTGYELYNLRSAASLPLGGQADAPAGANVPTVPTGDKHISSDSGHARVSTPVSVVSDRAANAASAISGASAAPVVSAPATPATVPGRVGRPTVSGTGGSSRTHTQPWRPAGVAPRGTHPASAEHNGVGSAHPSTNSAPVITSTIATASAPLDTTSSSSRIARVGASAAAVNSHVAVSSAPGTDSVPVPGALVANEQTMSDCSIDRALLITRAEPANYAGFGLLGALVVTDAAKAHSSNAQLSSVIDMVSASLDTAIPIVSALKIGAVYYRQAAGVSVKVEVATGSSIYAPIDISTFNSKRLPNLQKANKALTFGAAQIGVEVAFSAASSLDVGVEILRAIKTAEVAVGASAVYAGVNIQMQMAGGLSVLNGAQWILDSFNFDTAAAAAGGVQVALLASLAFAPQVSIPMRALYLFATACETYDTYSRVQEISSSYSADDEAKLSGDVVLHQDS